MSNGTKMTVNPNPQHKFASENMAPLSAWLLGFSDSQSAAFAGRKELAAMLVQRLVADGRDGALEELWAAFRAAGQGDAGHVLATLSAEAQSVAQTILAAWLLGRYLSFETAGDTGLRDTGVMGAAAYRQSLVWQLIGATPMGVPQPGTDVWATAPQVLT
jgi:hypothetical protein